MTSAVVITVPDTRQRTLLAAGPALIALEVHAETDRQPFSPTRRGEQVRELRSQLTA